MLGDAPPRGVPLIAGEFSKEVRTDSRGSREITGVAVPASRIGRTGEEVLASANASAVTRATTGPVFVVASAARRFASMSLDDDGIVSTTVRRLADPPCSCNSLHSRRSSAIFACIRIASLTPTSSAQHFLSRYQRHTSRQPHRSHDHPWSAKSTRASCKPSRSAGGIRFCMSVRRICLLARTEQEAAPLGNRQ